jgi:hypothetical protein
MVGLFLLGASPSPRRGYEYFHRRGILFLALATGDPCRADFINAAAIES